MGKIGTVAVIGLGPAGLVALKNLKEEGFEAVGFDRNSYIGGLWQYSTEERTSVMETTMVNFSKERMCFTDFPFPDHIASHPTAAQVQQYLLAYAAHFQLEASIRLNTHIAQITFDQERQKWIVQVQGEDTQYFDKVVIATGGIVGKAHMPTVEGMDKFAGISIHSQAFKRPSDFKGKRVMVVGFSNSAADTATQLAGIANKVYIAHRHGARVLPRHINGVAIDHTHSLRLFKFQSLMTKYFPKFSDKPFDRLIKRIQDKSFRVRPEWRFEPAGKVPIVSDSLVPCLEEGSVSSVAGVKRIVSETKVELDDGSSIEVDVIVWCTGYKSDFSIIEPKFDPTCRPQRWLDAPGSNGKSLFRLYHNVFSVEKPDSLAFLGNVQITIANFQQFDLATMAIAQVWANKSQLPPRDTMIAAVEKEHEWLIDLARRTPNVSPAHCNMGVWIRAMDRLAGTGVNEYLGYGPKGLGFRLKEPKYSSLLTGGIWSPHIHRVFDGKRKRWDGAKETIIQTNKRVRESKRTKGRAA
ncbi:dimethylaniline monooxygenase 2 [Bipolaris maydis]|nr:hypothetical protein BM1_03490 [Bipolaris maydis]KAJ6193026.1 dimethylaniline monooxygenase 2 [Bipolaris maydis]KAJ6276783.1 flavin monooxygenase-like protein [Bipolaris maydis]